MWVFDRKDFFKWSKRTTKLGRERKIENFPLVITSLVKEVIYSLLSLRERKSNVSIIKERERDERIRESEREQGRKM